MASGIFHYSLTNHFGKIQFFVMLCLFLSLTTRARNVVVEINCSVFVSNYLASDPSVLAVSEITAHFLSIPYSCLNSGSKLHF